MAYNLWETCVLFPGFSRGECAAWVQAWGSIAAIAAAIAIAGWQHHRDRRFAFETAKVHAELAGTSILLLLNPLLGMLEATRYQVLEAAKGAMPVGPGVWLEFLRTAEFPSEQELVAIANHDPPCARLLIRGRKLAAQAEQTCHLLAQSLGTESLDKPTVPEARLIYLMKLLFISEEQFREAKKRIEDLVPNENQ